MEALTTFDTQTVIPTGQSSTASVGSPTLDLTSVISLTGQAATSEVGDFDNAGTLVGWGRNGWGEEPYGDSFNKLVQLAGVSSTASNGSPTLDLTSVISLTGQSSTSSVGALTFRFNFCNNSNRSKCYNKRRFFNNRNWSNFSRSICNINSWWNNSRRSYRTTNRSTGNNFCR